MWYLLIAFLVIILFAGQSSTLSYKFVSDDYQIVGDCRNTPSNVLGLNGLLERSHLHLSARDEYIIISGNSSYIWDIDPSDRVEASFNVYRFDRGSWQQAPLSMSVPNICPILYDKEQFWYTFWTKYIINQEDVKDQCFSRGTKLIHQSAEFIVTIEFTGLPFNGRYKLITFLKAFDSHEVQRNTSICFEIIGTLDWKQIAENKQIKF